MLPHRRCVINHPKADTIPEPLHCYAGLVVAPGERCTYPGTTEEFWVDDSGRGHFIFSTAGTGIDMRGTTINGVTYNFKASKQADGTWLIEAAGTTTTTTTTTTVAPTTITPPAAEVPPGEYSDVTGNIHQAAIEALGADGLFDRTECAPGRFCPNDALPRWVMAVWLTRALDGQEPAETDFSRFADVGSDQWWAPHVERFADLGVTRGCKTNPLRYCPNTNVTRAQMATFINRALTAAATDDAVPGGELVIALTTQPNAIDGANAAERNAGNVANQIFDPLVWINDDLEFEPALAESWTVSDDGRAYTFKLREDVVFHNGEKFNADAVVFSWEVQKQPENQYFNYYERASEVNKIDEYTVELVHPEPNALFFGLAGAIWFFVPPEYYSEVGLTGFGQAPVGTGPFMFTEWVQGDRIVLDRNPNYWREGFPKLDRLVFRPITESSTRVAAIQTGEVDIVSRLSPDEAASLEGIDGVNVIEYPTNRVYYIAFNNLTSGVGQPTEDPVVRQALNHAVDVDGIIGALFNGKGVRATGLMTAAEFGYNSDLSPYAYDPDRARELLAQAGYPDGFDIGFACPSGAYTNFEQVCEAVAAQLAEVGVNASLEIMDNGAFWDLEAAKQLPPLFGDSWSNANPEGWDRLQGAMGGNAARWSAWSDPVVDYLLLQILATPDDAARADLYRQLQQRMYDDPPFIYLYVPFSFEARSDRVVNYKPRSAEEYWLWYLESAG